ncbi:hypothetical protein [Streptomyces sp. NPDC101393]|uniref:hypothetical protein n=1 Tax=Streptomyces sp. NPDC101393 TaxID=3366141 RepID=UPI0037F2746E
MSTARESIENLWDRAVPVVPLLDVYREEILRDVEQRIIRATNELPEGTDWVSGMVDARFVVSAMRRNEGES